MTQTKEFLSEIEWYKWQASHKLFALLDCAQLSKEDCCSFQSLDSSVCVGLFEGTPDAALNAVEPLLLDPLNIPTSHGMDWLTQNEKAKPMLLWLVSDVPMSKLARHLRSLLSADLPGAPDALLRFYDPRVFHKLMHVLNADQKTLFFTHAQPWWAWHKSSGKRQAYVSPAVEIQPVEKIVLSAMQIQALNQIDFDEFVQNIKSDMVRNKKKRLYTQDLSDSDVERQVGEHINKAMSFGFESEEAIVEYLHQVASTLGWGYEENNPGSIASNLQNESLTEDEKLAFLKSA